MSTFKGDHVFAGWDHSLLEKQHWAKVCRSILVTHLTDMQLGEYSYIATNALCHVSSVSAVLGPD